MSVELVIRAVSALILAGWAAGLVALYRQGAGPR